ncbi:MAG: zinc ABC transporter substrate-binding protein [Clostridiales bacterium]|mgnify:CR=1 FL=1|nr:zinc ABC transporter substrate-binding protein [Clostridiales bacterium]
MKRICRAALCLALVCLAGGLAACRGAEPSATSGGGETALRVVASFYPMYDFAVKVGGDRISAVNLVPAGTEPHDWEPSASDIAGLEKADVFVYNGAGMEHWVSDVLASLGNKSLITVEAAAGVVNREADPHVWLSPVRAKAQMRAIRDAFAGADPDGADAYNANFDRWAAELDALDAEFREALAPLPRRDVVVAHQAFGYLCAEYGLNQVAVEGLSPDAEPSPERMAQVIDFCRANDVRVIFFEELASPDVAAAIAAATGSRTDVLNPLEGLTNGQLEAGEDYLSVMRKNLAALAEALS